jgi:hypothetical protein
MRDSAIVLVAPLVLISACTGFISDESEGNGGPGSGQGGAGACAAELGSAPLRRLSHAEYQATIRELFADLAVPAPDVLHDPAEHGFENRAELLNPSPLLLEQYLAAAEDIAVRVAEKPAGFVPCTPSSDAEEQSCGQQFVAQFGAKVFRRPLTDQETKHYSAFFEQQRAASDFKGAVQLTTEVLLQSPQFLYRFEFGEDGEPGDRIKLTGYEIATRIAYLVSGTLPDQNLYDAAAGSALDSADEREAHARRLLASPRAGDMLVEFHRQWLDFDRLEQEPKDPATYPSYDEALKQAIREESDRFVRKIMWEGDGTLASFLTSTQAVVNEPLAKLYGVSISGSDWQPVTLDSTERAGWLTRANFLASRAHQLQGSPPLRSVFVLEKLFCLPPPDPPANANLSEPALSLGSGEAKTNRELFEERIAPAECKGCHSQIDTIGYGLEHYDAIGAFRTLDNGKPVDATGELKGVDVEGTFVGGVALSQRLAQSRQVQDCVAENWYAYALGRTLEEQDECQRTRLKQSLADAGGDIRELLVAVVRSPEFIYRPRPQ